MGTEYPPEVCAGRAEDQLAAADALLDEYEEDYQEDESAEFPSWAFAQHLYSTVAYMRRTLVRQEKQIKGLEESMAQLRLQLREGTR